MSFLQAEHQEFDSICSFGCGKLLEYTDQVDSIAPPLSLYHLLRSRSYHRYLLGSGGTTIFDLIIMIQSYAYQDLSPRFSDTESHIDHHHSHSHSHHQHHNNPHRASRSASTRRKDLSWLDEESRPLVIDRSVSQQSPLLSAHYGGTRSRSQDWENTAWNTTSHGKDGKGDRGGA